MEEHPHSFRHGVTLKNYCTNETLGAPESLNYCFKRNTLINKEYIIRLLQNRMRNASTAY